MSGPRHTMYFSTVRLASVTLLLALLAGLLAHTPAQADVAPPQFPQGANPQPGSAGTQVRMEAEQVRLDVANLPEGREAGRAAVTADFQMQNEGSAEEQMEVRFPLSVLNGQGDGWGNYPEIKDLLVWVDGRRVTTTRVTSPNPAQAGDPPLAWAGFDVTFPPGVPVPIKVTYTAEGIGEHPDVRFSYVLETGAGWKGTIGKADLSVHLPYQANSLNVIVPSCTDGMTMNGNDLVWHFEDLEPQKGQNLDVGLMMTGVWQTIQTERQNVKATPKDGEAWGRLGKIYKESLQNHHGWRDDEGGKQIYQLSVEAYDKAVTLLPKDALWHYGFADLLWFHFRLYSFYDGHPNLPGLTRAIQEIKASLDLDPKNQDAIYLAQDIQQNVPGAILGEAGHFTYPGLTATPVVTSFPSQTPNPTDTPVIVASETSIPAPTRAATATHAQAKTPLPKLPPNATPLQGQAGSDTGALAKKPSLPICGAGMILPISILLRIGLVFRKPPR